MKKQLHEMTKEELIGEAVDLAGSVLVERQKNDNLKQCIEELLSTKVSLQRKALKAKTNIIKAQAIEEFKAYVKSGLKVLNEPSWQGKRPVVIDEKTYFEMTLSEFDDYANKLRGI